jgi:hypothetical protein
MDTLTVLDTDVFIDRFRGLTVATAYIQGLRVAQRATTVSWNWSLRARGENL